MLSCFPLGRGCSGSKPLWHLVGHPPQDTHLDKTDSTFCAKFMIMIVPCKILNNSFPRTKRKETTTLFHRHGHVLQVHEGDQSSLPPLWNSFVGTGIHNGPVPPAAKTVQVLLLLRRSTHTQCRVFNECFGGCQIGYLPHICCYLLRV